MRYMYIRGTAYVYIGTYIGVEVWAKRATHVEFIYVCFAWFRLLKSGNSTPAQLLQAKKARALENQKPKAAARPPTNIYRVRIATVTVTLK